MHLWLRRLRNGRKRGSSLWTLFLRIVIVIEACGTEYPYRGELTDDEAKTGGNENTRGM
jgi:hypothetical protein